MRLQSTASNVADQASRRTASSITAIAVRRHDEETSGGLQQEQGPRHGQRLSCSYEPEPFQSGMADDL